MSHANDVALPMLAGMGRKKKRSVNVVGVSQEDPALAAGRTRTAANLREQRCRHR